MFTRRKLYLFALVVLAYWTYYMFVNREHFVREHLASKPTLLSIEKKLEETDKKVDKLTSEFQKQNQQMQAQSQQAAAAKASLDAINTGYNNVIPVR